MKDYGPEFIQQLKSMEPTIFKFAKLCNIPGMDLDDVRQEFRITVMTSWRNYNPDSGVQFRTFAYTNIQNRKNELLRESIAQKREKDRMMLSLDNAYSEDCETLLNIVYSPDDSPEDAVMQKETFAVVRDIIESAPENVRGIYLDLLAGLTQTTIAERRHTCQSNVSYHLGILRSKVRAALQ